MRLRKIFTLGVTMLALTASPILAEGKGGHKKHHADHARGWNCPPGLAKKNPPCVPPGQARKHDRDHNRDHRHRVGDRFDPGDYIMIRDPWRYGLRESDGWRYYRDDQQIFRVDSGTRKVLAVLELIDAFSN